MLSAGLIKSFAISLAIVIAVTQTPVCGFTIRRRYTTSDSITDLMGEGSSLLEVKYDTEINDANAIDVNHNKGEMDTAVYAINRTNEILHNSKGNSLQSISNNDIAKYTGKSNLPRNTGKEHNSKTDRNKDVNKPTSQESNNITIHSELNEKIDLNKINVTENETNPRLSITNNFTTSKTILKIQAINEFVQNETIPFTEVSTAPKTDINGLTITSENTNSYSTLNEVNSFTYVTTESESEMYDVKSNTDWTTSEISRMTQSDATYSDITETSTHNTNPIQKKYTIIDRKRATTTENILQMPETANMVEAEKAQTMVTLGNIIDMTPISSLENLSETYNNMTMDGNKLPTIRDELVDVTEDYLSTLKSQPLQSTQIITTKIPSAKLGIVSSKRGGYLDNTDTTTVSVVEILRDKLDSDNTSYTEIFGSTYNPDSSDGGHVENKNASVIESQSQMVEDAIREELLREQTLSDIEENSKRYSDDGAKFLNDIRNKQNSTATDINDVLRVKPITSQPPDKKMNASLYAVSPNYKPLKKIDVQPPKQFVRDPDDNSWRNESISSLGIVFKPKNASKSFTQVLKNKTEIELNSTSEKENKGDVPDLRVRLEKIAEVRKSKKKKTNKFGEIVYTDYDSGESTNVSTKETTLTTTPFIDSQLSLTKPKPPGVTSLEPNLSVNSARKEKNDIFNPKDPSLLTTHKPNKFFNIAEYYDTTDEYDADYLKVTKIDLKKFTKPTIIKEKQMTQAPITYTTPLTNDFSERRPTVQYFPPTKKVSQKVSVDDYDTDFQSKLNLFVTKDSPNNVLPISYGTVSPTRTETEPNRVTLNSAFTPMYNPENVDEKTYLPHHAHITKPHDGYTINEGNFNRASYVIKHYKDFINEAMKDNDDDRNIDYHYTEAPVQGVTINEMAKLTERDGKIPGENYDDDVQFRKDLINRFVDNFNQNSERFKVDFPILYNTSVVHSNILDNSKVLASSTAYLRRQYDTANVRFNGYLTNPKPCEPNCEKLTVELSPDYELHYYIPEQEEKEEIDHKQITAPYRYRNMQL